MAPPGRSGQAPRGHRESASRLPRGILAFPSVDNPTAGAYRAPSANPRSSDHRLRAYVGKEPSMYRRPCLGLLVVALVALSTSSFAQGTSAASITGVVTDSSGAVLPGVTVEASSPVLIEKVRTTVTDEKGEYRI